MSVQATRRLSVASLLCMTIGLGLVALSFVLPWFDAGEGQWSNEEALEFQQSAARIHQLSPSPQAIPTLEERQALLEAQQHHDELDTQRREAIESARRRQRAFRWSGIALVIVGAALHALSRNRPA